MLRLAATLYGMTASTLAGTAVVIALVAGYATLLPLVIAAGLGGVLALPISLYAAWKLAGRGG